ncbi:MAG: hypothetical protein IV100_14445 [Myxococcales bacterium]|nr:hypothetical protein [Myxococcales bacterium]
MSDDTNVHPIRKDDPSYGESYNAVENGEFVDNFGRRAFESETSGAGSPVKPWLVFLAYGLGVILALLGAVLVVTAALQRSGASKDQEEVWKSWMAIAVPPSRPPPSPVAGSIPIDRSSADFQDSCLRILTLKTEIGPEKRGAFQHLCKADPASTLIALFESRPAGASVAEAVLPAGNDELSQPRAAAPRTFAPPSGCGDPAFLATVRRIYDTCKNTTNCKSHALPTVSDIDFEVLFRAGVAILIPYPSMKFALSTKTKLDAAGAEVPASRDQNTHLLARWWRQDVAGATEKLVVICAGLASPDSVGMPEFDERIADKRARACREFLELEAAHPEWNGGRAVDKIEVKAVNLGAQRVTGAFCPQLANAEARQKCELKAELARLRTLFVFSIPKACLASP